MAKRKRNVQGLGQSIIDYCRNKRVYPEKGEYFWLTNKAKKIDIEAKEHLGDTFQNVTALLRFYGGYADKVNYTRFKRILDYGFSLETALTEKARFHPIIDHNNIGKILLGS
jgi:hypothetical protein